MPKNASHSTECLTKTVYLSKVEKYKLCKQKVRDQV
jgi:hypothetical protein